MAINEKKAALIVGAVFVSGLAVWIYYKPAIAKLDQIINKTSAPLPPLPDIAIPGIIMPDFSREPFSMPAFALPENQFQMISGCCSDCNSKSAPTTGYLPAGYGPTIVFNEGNRTGTTYNYIDAGPSAPSGSTTFYGG